MMNSRQADASMSSSATAQKNARILIVEDDTDINHLLAEILSREGYAVSQAFSGTEALIYLEERPDLILLDLMLPGLSGEELLKKIREQSWTPVIVISGRSELNVRVSTLASGADDYILKPFASAEVLARVAAQLRRFKIAVAETDAEAETCYRYESLILDTQAHRVSWGDQLIELTQTEFEILTCLMKEPGTVFSRDRLYREVWDSDFVGDDNAVNVHVSHLRKKLKQASGRELIGTIWGIGYKLG